MCETGMSTEPIIIIVIFSQLGRGRSGEVSGVEDCPLFGVDSEVE